MDLYKRYNARFDMTPEFSREEAHHWFVPKVGPNEQQVVWTYVVEVSHCVIKSSENGH
jgi:glycylpeptide N-tetradecanoyltransferase